METTSLQIPEMEYSLNGLNGLPKEQMLYSELRELLKVDFSNETTDNCQRIASESGLPESVSTEIYDRALMDEIIDEIKRYRAEEKEKELKE
jgi:hypothetical protein